MASRAGTLVERESRPFAGKGAMSGQKHGGVIKANASMGAVVTRADGTQESVGGFDGPRLIELNYEQAVEMFGQEQADELFLERDAKQSD